MGSMLCFFGFGMFKFGEGEINMDIGGYVYITFDVVPVEFEASIKFSIPIYGCFIAVFDRIYEVIGIDAIEIFYAKIVNIEGECWCITTCLMYTSSVNSCRRQFWLRAV